LDRLDLEILKALLVNNGVPPGNLALRKSFRSMAKELGVDQGTIRARMKRLQEQRVLKGWYLGVNPGLTGHDVLNAWFGVQNESMKDDLAARLLSLADMERVCDYLGPKMSCVFFQKKANLADSQSRLERLASPSGVLLRHNLIQVPRFLLKETELAIIEKLGKDPWKPYSDVAEELGLSSRTVRRVASRLSDDGAIYMLPIIDLKALQGIVPVELVVGYTSPDSKPKANGRIASYVKEGLVFSDTKGPFGYFALVVTNVSQVPQILKWVQRQDGVKEAHVEVLQDVMLNRNHYLGRRLSGEKAMEKEEVHVPKVPKR